MWDEHLVRSSPILTKSNLRTLNTLPKSYRQFGFSSRGIDPER